MEVHASNLMRVLEGKTAKGDNTTYLFLPYFGALLPDGSRRNLVVTGPHSEGEAVWLETYECIQDGNKTMLRIVKSVYEVTEIADGWDKDKGIHTFTITMKDNTGVFIF